MLNQKQLSTSLRKIFAQSRPHISDWVLVLIGLVAIVLVAVVSVAVVNRGPLSEVPREETSRNLEMVSKEGTAVTASEANSSFTSIGESSQAKRGVIVLLPTATVTTVPIPTLEASPPSKKHLPAEIVLRDVPIGRQTRALNCEFQTASDLAWYHGRPFTWEEIYNYVGHDVGGNPHKGFVGRSIDDKPGQLYPMGYGVYAEPIARAFAQLGLEAKVFYNQSREWLMAQLADGRPVMVWATNDMTIRPVATWVTADGTTAKGVPGEHTYLAVGYDSRGVWLIDPWDGRRSHFAWETFIASWSLLDRMSLVVVGDRK